MTMLEVSRCAPPSEWDRFVADHPRATAFHRREWLSLVRHLSRSELHLLLFRRQGTLVGGVPLFVFRRGPFRIAASPPAQVATPYLGPVVDDALLGEALAALERAARELKAAYVETRLDREIPAALLRRAGFGCEPRTTFVLELDENPETLWSKRVSSACRRAIRKAQAQGVVVAEESLDDIVAPYAELAAAVFAKSNRQPPLTRKDYGELARAARQGKGVRVFTARLGGRLAAAGIFPFGNGTVYYLDGVSDQEVQQARPSNLLHWEVIRWACETGLRRYDMVGAGIAGVARFKRGFGPAEVPYTYAFRSLTPLAALARAAYALLAPAGRTLGYAAAQLRRRQ